MGKIDNLDFKKNNLRSINNFLQNIDYKKNKRDFIIKNPNGNHAICAGLKEDISVTIKGHVGYYCGGMNKKAKITIEGNAGTGLGENMMSGLIHVKGNDPAGISTQDPKLMKRLDPIKAGKKLSNYLKVMTLEAQTIARACGKNSLHNLEPEDLCAFFTITF